MKTLPAHYFDFEAMDVYDVSKEVARWFRSTRWPTNSGKLRDQGMHAADSAALNIAEGRMTGGARGRHHYRIAHGSAGEACAVLDLIDLDGGAEQQAKLRRVGAMLNRLR